MDLSILYRGPLSSCNYFCHYCPFAKHHETAAELRTDREALSRFVERVVELQDWTISVFFTPWGEALVRPWYQETIARLSRQNHLKKVAIQTNLSCRLDWLDGCDIEKVGLWCTYHPSQVSRAEFITRCLALVERGVTFSVGMVGLREDFAEMESLRSELPKSVYFWINAYKDESAYYSDKEVRWLESLDPLFRTNTIRHASLGMACRSGKSVVSIDGGGTMRRCHFVKNPIGNFYDDGFARGLVERSCPNQTCGCHIGYVHMDSLNLYATYGEGILERVPLKF